MSRESAEDHVGLRKELVRKPEDTRGIQHDLAVTFKEVEERGLQGTHCCNV